MDGEEIRLPEHIYHEVRLDINRAHDAALRFANGEKVKRVVSPSEKPAAERSSRMVENRPCCDAVTGVVGVNRMSKRCVATGAQAVA